jgi:hypothetical protein
MPLKLFRRYETRAIAEMGIRAITKIHFDVLILVLASVACQLLLTGEFTVLYSLSNIWYAI